MSAVGVTDENSNLFLQLFLASLYDYKAVILGAVNESKWVILDLTPVLKEQVWNKA